VVLCVWPLGVPTRFHVPTPLLTEIDRCGLVGLGFCPFKLQKPTVQIMMAISVAIVARRPTVFMVGEARKNHLVCAAILFPAILTGDSCVDRVEILL
jgi:hypothetical protein